MNFHVSIQALQIFSHENSGHWQDQTCETRVLADEFDCDQNKADFVTFIKRQAALEASTH